MRAKAIPIEKLKPGDKFIWADENTRRFMCCGPHALKSGDGTEYVGINEFVRHEDDDGFVFVGRNEEHEFCYEPGNHYVFLVPSSRGDMFSMDLKCVGCGRRFGAHNGLHCMSENKFGTTFIPDIKSHTSNDERFFEELGL